MITQNELIIETAEKYIGVKESPPGSNNVIFNTEYYGRPVNGSAYKWCCVFIWYLFKAAGLSPLLCGGLKTASCTATMNYAKKNGFFHDTEFVSGDIALFNWDGAKNTAHHIGIITNTDPKNVYTIEGNTSFSQNSDGGEVMRRTRRYNQIIGVYRPAYETEYQEVWDDDMKRYNTLEEIPDYAKDTIERLIKTGAIKGGGNSDEHGFPADLNLSEDMIRLIIIHERAGAFRF